MNRVSLSASVLVTVLLVGSTAAGTPASVDLPAMKDNTLFESDPDASSGAGPVFFSGETSISGSRRAVLAFDIAGGIPPGSTLHGVSLILRVGNGGPASSPTDVYRLHRLLADWGEAGSSSPGGQGAPAQTGDATWAHRFHPSETWSVLGGDYSLARSAAAQVPIGADVQFSSSAMLTDVAGWFANPGSNFGWILIGVENSPGTARFFFSREGAVPPVLQVEFTPPPGAGAVPDGGSVPGQPLRIAKSGTPSSPTIDLEWSAGCRIEPDYSVYVGQIGQYYDHDFLVCSTGGQLRLLDHTPGPANEYYLVVPISYADEEGSYGLDGGLNQRPTGSTACPRPQVLATPVCP